MRFLSSTVANRTKCALYAHCAVCVCIPCSLNIPYYGVRLLARMLTCSAAAHYLSVSLRSMGLTVAAVVAATASAAAAV